MQLFIRDDDGAIVATYINGALLAGFDFDEQAFAFELFKLTFSLMGKVGGGAGAAGGVGFENLADVGEGGGP